MKTKEEPKVEQKPESIDEKITRYSAELAEAVKQYNFCQKRIEELTPRINYLSGKIDALKELTKP